MTLREIIYDILEIVNAYSDDSKISEEHVAFMVNNKRNMLLKQYMSNIKKEIPQEAIQNICVTLAEDTNCLEDSIVVKSTIKFPPTLDNTGRSNIVKAYGSNSRFLKNVNVIDYSRLPYVASERYNKHMLFITLDPKSYVIVFNSDNKHILMENIELEGVFENPEEAYTLTCDYDSSIDFYDTQYPIESAMIEPLRQSIVQELVTKYKIPLDHINDGEDNINIADARKRRL